MALASALLDILQRPTRGDVVFELTVFMAPVWIAVVVGVLVGWAWKPKWAANVNLDFDSTMKKSRMVFPQFAASVSNLSSLKLELPNCISWIPEFVVEKGNLSSPSVSSPEYSLANLENEKSSVVNENDLKHLHKLVEEKDGGPVWIQMMDRSTANMSYQAWRRDPEIGPPQYRSRTIYEDASPEMLRDFFWDDEFRIKWDDMLLQAQTLEDCSNTGTMIVQWVRKFPFFCSDREYIIGRRIWESARTYYCVTKGVPCSSIPRRAKPRRVDLYYSSWFIRAAESKRDGRMTACEVILFHHEDMGIPWEIAKLGIRQGMWGAVKKIDPGLRAYQIHRASGAPLSRSALISQTNTKFFVDSIESLESTNCESDAKTVVSSSTEEKASSGRNLSKLIIAGGAVALACSFDRGLLSKAVIFGVARRFARTGRML